MIENIDFTSLAHVPQMLKLVTTKYVCKGKILDQGDYMSGATSKKVSGKT